LPSASGFRFTIDPRQQAWKAQICMRDVIRAVVMVLVDRKFEASMELWTVGSKLCGGWRRRLGAGSLSESSLLDGQRELKDGRDWWNRGEW
jgi:hypothetical protein